MTASAQSLPATGVALPQAHTTAGLVRIYLLEARYEMVKLLRLPGFLIPSLGFPMMFYTLFGLVLPMSKSSFQASMYLLATYGAFGVIGIALFALGVGVAMERGQGWLAVKRASPMPLTAYFFGKYAMTVALSTVLLILLATLGVVFGHVRMPALHWVALFGTLMFGGIPFCAAGLAIAYLVGPNSAPAIVNAFYLPSAFLSGLFIPAEMLPPFLQNVAQFLPPYHLARLALTAVGVEPVSKIWIHIGALLAFSIVFTAIAALAYRRDEGKTFG